MFGGWTYKTKPELEKISEDVTSSSSNSRTNSRSKRSKKSSSSSSSSSNSKYYKKRREKKGRGDSVNKIRKRKNMTMKSRRQGIN